MKKLIASIRKDINAHKTYYAFCAGSVATSCVFLYLTKDKTILSVTREQLEMLKKGYSIAYVLKDQTLHLVNLDSVKALADTL